MNQLNLQFQQPSQRTSYSGTDSQYNMDQDSFFSSVLSPSMTAQEKPTPRDGNSNDVRFEFPPELQTISSSGSESVSSDEDRRQIVPSSSNNNYHQNHQHYQNHHQQQYPNQNNSVVSFTSSQKQNMQLVPFYAPQPEQQVSIQCEPSSIRRSNTSSEQLQLALSPASSSSSFKVPRSNNPFGADAVHPKKKTMKKQRKRRTAAGSFGGMVVGGLVLGPAGVVVGAAAGGVAANRFCKSREKKAQRKYEQRSFQNAAARSNVHQGYYA